MSYRKFLPVEGPDPLLVYKDQLSDVLREDGFIIRDSRALTFLAAAVLHILEEMFTLVANYARLHNVGEEGHPGWMNEKMVDQAIMGDPEFKEQLRGWRERVNGREYYHSFIHNTVLQEYYPDLVYSRDWEVMVNLYIHDIVKQLELSLPQGPDEITMDDVILALNNTLIGEIGKGAITRGYKVLHDLPMKRPPLPLRSMPRRGYY